MADQLQNLIDLGQYPKNDVELIAREFLRVVYIESIQDYSEEAQKEDKDNELITNMERALQAIETVIVMLDGNEEFLQYIHEGAEGGEGGEDDEYDRF
jgi:hypothetical protein